MHTTYSEIYRSYDSHRSQSKAFYENNLKDIFELLGVDAEYRIDQVLSSWKQRIDTRVRNSILLTRQVSNASQEDPAYFDRPRHTKINRTLRVRLTSYIPLEVQEVLSSLEEVTLWVLLNNREIGTSVRLLGQMDKMGWGQYDPFPHHEVDVTHDFLEKVNSEAGEKARKAVRKILSSPADILGAYYIRDQHIELHWIVIWIIAYQLNVSVEDLSLVVLIHELAHFYSHVGFDADGHFWDTEAFINSDIHVLEGIAQYYTFKICRDLQSDIGNSRPLEAFTSLLEYQSSPYRCFLDWAPEHSKRSEVIRSAIVEARAHPNHESRGAKYPQFMDLVAKLEKDL